MRGDGLRNARRRGIANYDAVGDIQVQRFALILQHSIEVSRKAFLQKFRCQLCIEREKSALFQAAL